jgi:hypothetical protein
VMPAGTSGAPDDPWLSSVAGSMPLLVI